MQFQQILEKIMVLNRDDGRIFTDTRRLDVINSLLWNSGYRRINTQGLFVLYSKVPIEELESPILVSSHVDCEMGIHNCFTKDEDCDLMRGTYDNGITNAAILTLMIKGTLPDNVIVAFTGDEERGSKGASQVAQFLLEKRRKPIITIVLDVTDMGWQEGADFTLENNFWEDDMGRKVVNRLQDIPGKWLFVPSDPDEIPTYLDSRKVVKEEAEADESWEYDEQEFTCFSLCIPVYGDMHSDNGVIVRKSGSARYLEALEKLLL